jgi:hypothetical protein
MSRPTDDRRHLLRPRKRDRRAAGLTDAFIARASNNRRLLESGELAAGGETRLSTSGPST